MEKLGIAVDVDRLEDLRGQFDAAVTAAQQAAWEVLGHEVNLGSPKQLQTVLFDELGMPKTRRTKSGYTTDAEALEGLFAKTEHPFLGHLLAHRDAIRLRQTVDGLLASVTPDRRIHTTYVQTMAATGRLSSIDPNLQNIPIRTELGRQIRSAFIAGDGFENLMSADYSQIEMRLMAHASGDEGLIEAFLLGARLPQRDGIPGLQRPPRGLHTSDAGPDQGHELRACLWPQRVRAVEPAQNFRRGGEGAHGGLLLTHGRCAGLSCGHRVRGPSSRVHLHHARASQVLARPADRATASAAKWRNGPL